MSTNFWCAVSSGVLLVVVWRKNAAEFFSAMKLPHVEKVHVQAMPYLPVLELAKKLPRPFFLLHTARVQGEHRWSILGVKPLALTKSFAELEHALAQTRSSGPFAERIGWFVAISYEAKIQAVLCAEYYVFDEQEKKLFKVELQSSEPVMVYAPVFGEKSTSQAWQAQMSREEFVHKVAQVREHIAAGDVYQVNLAQKFSAATVEDLFLLYQSCVHMNPAPMQAYFEFPDFTLLSTSPERFLKRVGEQVFTQPIKGTKPRGANAFEDEKFSAELRSSEKDAAELAMIVDLMRNDLGKLAETGSVRVSCAAHIEAYANVFQQVAQVEAKVSQRISSLKLIQACFPAGSITGCPKMRAMEIIADLEPTPRDFYCGSLGILVLNGDFDLNVAIRTLTAHAEQMHFSVGSGIVFDSDPESEYQETLVKGKTFFEVLKNG